MENKVVQNDPNFYCPLSSLKMPHIFNSSGQQKTAELFRTDFITAMKLNDAEQIDLSTCLVIEDPWRNEWNQGVQVPVNIDGIKRPVTRPSRLVHCFKDEFYDSSVHVLSKPAVDNQCCYDLDDLDIRWLMLINMQRQLNGENEIEAFTVERVMESIEKTCNETIEHNKQGTSGLEFDEDTVCDVCLSPFCDDDNEMVFCDMCEVCVHQACYGIQRVPSGPWLCRTCSMGAVKPACIFCPNLGGAMKSTKSGQRWAHVSCALWIPEVAFGNQELMEPVINIAAVPEERWLLRCAICRERQGACIQCSHRSCRIAYHVTCAQQFGADIRIVSDEISGDLRLLSYCQRHGVKRPPRKQQTSEQKEEARRKRMLEAQDQFYSIVDPKEIASSLRVPASIVFIIYEYWKLKRKANFNQTLMKSKKEEERQLEKLQEDALFRRIRMLIYLRQNLEKARNLSYMIVKREKLKKQWLTCFEDAFQCHANLLCDNRFSSMSLDLNALFGVHFHHESIYDRLLNKPSPPLTTKRKQSSTSPNEKRQQLNTSPKLSLELLPKQDKDAQLAASSRLNGLIKESAVILSGPLNANGDIYGSLSPKRSHLANGYATRSSRNCKILPRQILENSLNSQTRT